MKLPRLPCICGSAAAGVSADSLELSHRLLLLELCRQYFPSHFGGRKSTPHSAYTANVFLCISLPQPLSSSVISDKFRKEISLEAQYPEIRHPKVVLRSAISNQPAGNFEIRAAANETPPPPPTQKPHIPIMPREGYQVPTGSAVGAPRGSTGMVEARTSAMTYLCGDCGGSVSLGRDALVACPHCAGRVLYKERTKR